MALELDHFLIMVQPGAPEADHLNDLGLVEGTSNSHPGQGTANRRFFFRNTALELAYLSDAEEAETGPGKDLRVAARWRTPEASPFGIIVRQTPPADEPPFLGWRYYPQYFDGDTYFHVGENSEALGEPLCIVMPAFPPNPSAQPEPAPDFSHVTELRISLPQHRASAVLQAVDQIDGVTLVFGKPHLMELTFNSRVQGQTKDLRPDLPLIVYW